MVRFCSTNHTLAWAIPVLAEAAALGRSIAFAWSLGADELGRAMMLALVVRLIEMTSDVGIDRLLIQAPDGNQRLLQAQLHGAAMIRGWISAGLLIILAPIAALTFADGPSAFAFAALAVVPLLRGFTHLDYRRAERHFVYTKMAVVEGGATSAMLICLGPAVWIFPDYRAMCVILITHAFAYLILSHAVANRAYRLKVSIATLRRCWVFGAPLILNAGLMFLTFYADRLIVAYAFDWSSVAIYGVALQLALLPSQIVGRAASSLVLPRLRRALPKYNFSNTWHSILRWHFFLGLGLVTSFVAFAPFMISLVYGDAFRPDAMLTLSLATAAGFRTMRTPFSLLAIATGRTGDPARANAIRAFAVIPALLFAAAGLPMAAIAAAAALGEAGATYRAYTLRKGSLAHNQFKEAIS